ncbi:MAG: DCC1-like thiol-disulfide oxidoreductase family protein [Xenococcus sp. MO_188.B8]|nr:DCC1-like thiol-disulfide oxidoreductase family protein [Xenococcus sp. MO_188.B8]
MNNRISQDQIRKPIVFFDGECIMCNQFVDILLNIDKTGTIMIAPLQGKTAAKFLPPLPNNREEWSIFYIAEDKIYDQSDAFLNICRSLGGIWSILSLFKIIPRPIRDSIYRVIARNRYRIFGRRSTCRMPNEQEKLRFLP